MKERIKQLEKIGFEWNVDVDVNMQAKKNHSESIKRQGEDSRHQEGIKDCTSISKFNE